MRENADQKNPEYEHFSRSEFLSMNKDIVISPEKLPMDWLSHLGHMRCFCTVVF